MSERSLFRNEAVEFQQLAREHGSVGALQPPTSIICTWLLAACAAAIVIFLCFADYARKETVIGYLAPTTGTAKIFAAQKGTIEHVFVEEGQAVDAGQPLLTVQTNELGADGVDVNTTVLQALLEQRRLLSESVAREEAQGRSEGDRLTALIAGLRNEIAEAQGQAGIQDERLQIAEDSLATGNRLRSKGIMTDPDFQARQLQALEQKQALAALKQQIAARQNQLTETEFALRELPTTTEQKVQALRNDLTAVEQRIAETSARRAYMIRAPRSGLVSTVQAVAGQSVDPERLQLEIIPRDAVFQVQLFVPARAIGFVRPGQRVRILFDAFPYQHFGTYGGEVVRISRTLISGPSAGGPIALQEPAYRVTAALNQSGLSISGKEIALQPDMLLKADIILEKRSLMSWLTGPLRGVRI